VHNAEELVVFFIQRNEQQALPCLHPHNGLLLPEKSQLPLLLW
jgi:hypothetical protein